MQDLILRKIKTTDKKDIFVWRNDEVTKKMSFNTSPVGIKEHEIWFNKALNDKERVFYIAGFDNSQKIGVVSFDKIDGNDYKVNVNLNPAFRGRGLGSRVIKEGCLRLIAEKNTAYIIAKVKEENTASIKAFTKAGFVKLSEEGNVINMCFRAG